jgi:S1-C subfamily serine protease
VIGINTAIYGNGGSAEGGNIGIGFAMPINKAKAALEEYRTSGRISPPVLGVEAVRIEGDLAEDLGLPRSGGLLVQKVEPGSSAEDSGVRGPRQFVVVGNYQLGVGGDLITAIDGKVATSASDIEKAMSHKRAGDKLVLTVLRNGQQVLVTITLSASAETL